LLNVIGIDDLVHFDFIDPPTPEALMRALETLHYIGALDDEGELTAIGKLMSEFPVDPLLAKILVTSAEKRLSCSNEVVTIVAMLSVPNPLLRPRDKKKYADIQHEKFRHSDGDFIMLLNVYHAYKTKASDSKHSLATWLKEHYLNGRHLASADHVRAQLARLLERHDLALVSPPVFGTRDYYDRILKAFLSGFFMQVAHLESPNGFYATVKDNQTVKLHPSTCLDTKPEWTMYAEFVLTSHQFIRTVSKINIDWLFQEAPQFYQQVETFPDCHATKALKSHLLKLSKKRKAAD
jgi:pre-mRNA-splicing factor ATP-dependent RNA helicase DHX15/PRP43